MGNDDETLHMVVAHLTAFVREHGEQVGARMGAELRRQFPRFDLRRAGFSSLTDLLERAAPELSIIGRRGLDHVWSTESDLGDFEVEPPYGGELGDKDLARVATALVADSITLTCFRARNFKSLAHVDVPLRCFNVIVGANGAGKTSVLAGMHLLSQLRNKKPAAVFSASRSVGLLTTVHQPGPLTLRIEDSEGEFFEYQGEAQIDELDHHLVRFGHDGQHVEHDYGGGPLSGPLPRDHKLLRIFGGTTLLSLDARQLARPWVSSDEDPTLRYDGGGLPAVLANLAATDRERLDEIIAATHAIIPAFEAVRMPRQTVVRRRTDAPEIGNGLELRVHGHWIDASLASEGTLLVLGLMTIVHGLSSTRLLLMDDIDRALHPKAQRALVTQLAALGARGLQIVCTTHSPYLLDAVDPGDILVARAAPEDGQTRIRRLVDHAEWGKWSRSMKPGVFWSYVGEDWLESE
ncbi:MAG: AAA family ATPase [Enhygromyxa sp.]